MEGICLKVDTWTNTIWDTEQPALWVPYLRRHSPKAACSFHEEIDWWMKQIEWCSQKCRLVLWHYICTCLSRFPSIFAIAKVWPAKWDNQYWIEGECVAIYTNISALLSWLASRGGIYWSPWRYCSDQYTLTIIVNIIANKQSNALWTVDVYNTMPRVLVDCQIKVKWIWMMNHPVGWLSIDTPEVINQNDAMHIEIEVTCDCSVVVCGCSIRSILTHHKEQVEEFVWKRFDST